MMHATARPLHLSHAPPHAAPPRARLLVPRAAMLGRQPQIYHPLFSGEWEECDPLASTDDVFKLFVRHQPETELTSLWKTVDDIMQARVITTTPEASLLEARLKMKLNGIGGMPVVDPSSGKLLGVICLSDLRKPGPTVRAAMTSPATAVRASAAIPEAAALMLEHDLDRLPVVDDSGRCIGIVTRTDMFWTLVVDNDQADCALKYSCRI